MKPRVLQLVDSFNEGGSERQALQLTRLLRDSGRYDVFLATLNAEGVLRADAQSLSAAIPEYPLTSFYDYNAVRQLSSFVRYLRIQKIDLVHTHDFYTNLFGMTAAVIAGVRVRIASRRETSGMRNKSQLILQRMAYAMAHQIVANSVAVRSKLIDEGVGTERISIIHNGVDWGRLKASTSTSRTDSLRALGLEKHNLRSGFVTIIANMRHDVKDYPMFLRAAQLVSQALPETGFLLAGEGDLQSSIRTLATELGLSGKVVFLGQCRQIAQLLNVSDVCVLSSKAEGFSNSIIEYMAAARPVVATNVGGASEAILEGETGFLVDSGDHEAMAARIVSLLEDPESARAMGEKGKQRVDQSFSSKALLQNTTELYDRLLNPVAKDQQQRSSVLAAANSLDHERA